VNQHEATTTPDRETGAIEMESPIAVSLRKEAFRCGRTHRLGRPFCEDTPRNAPRVPAGFGMVRKSAPYRLEIAPSSALSRTNLPHGKDRQRYALYLTVF
jgi:hypothetical protein